ncbi:MAG: cation:proton antiporter [Paludibacteraceae bacterium]|nr:cation:proton antiporter [Prolixibacteraceae bacterium]MBN2787363.1 cation:proton antiporter [Paludibacteraceae bacterium]
MAYQVIIAFCIIILLAYLFDITGKYSKIPGVLLLILLGIIIRVLVTRAGLYVPDLEPVLPIIGTLGLILIVMEASLDLRINNEKKKIIQKSILSAVVLFFLFIFIFSYVLNAFFSIPWDTALLNAIPLGIISSAVAIPAASNISPANKEFVVYESSFSDILGILVFDFIVVGFVSVSSGLTNLLLDSFVTLLISILATTALALLLHKTTHHVNYVIIMTFIILIYTLAKLIHLPALLFVLIFGLVLANYRFLEIPFTRKFINFEKFGKDIESFKNISGELTFLVRSFFFIMFGYLTKLDELLNGQNLTFSAGIVLFLILLRWLFFKQVIKEPIIPLLFYAPRGLITILLFLSIPEINRLEIINEGIVTQVIFISILLLSPGNMLNKTKTTLQQ